MFIHYGKGYHILNDERYEYAGPCVFMLSPADHHLIEIVEETQFSVLKFTNVYLSGGRPTPFEPDWDAILNNLRNACREHDGLSKYAGQLENASQLIYLVVKEWQARPQPNNEVILHLMRGVISLLGQAVEDKLQDQFDTIPGDATRLLHYIHQHIQEPAMLQTDAMAANLGLPKGRLPLFFRRQTGMSIKDYINDYKGKLIENRLLYSTLSIKEISNEFGFTDMSHLNKFFRKQRGVSPRKYRDGYRAAPGPAQSFR